MTFDKALKKTQSHAVAQNVGQQNASLQNVARSSPHAIGIGAVPANALPVSRESSAVWTTPVIGSAQRAHPATDLDRPAMQMLLPELRILWAAKWGDVWVSEEMTREADGTVFWALAWWRMRYAPNTEAVPTSTGVFIRPAPEAV